MKPKLVIFDLDNTLAVTSVAAKEAYRHAISFLAKQNGLEHQADKLYNHWKRIVSRLKTETDPTKRQFAYSLGLLASEHQIPLAHIPKALTQYETKFYEALKPQHGVKELFDWLKDEGIAIAVATESLKAQAKKKLKATGLYSSVAHLVTATDIGTMKPNPDYFNQVLAKAKIKPMHTVVVGDSSLNDIEPAKKLGLHAIQVPRKTFHLGTIKQAIQDLIVS